MSLVSPLFLEHGVFVRYSAILFEIENRQSEPTLLLFGATTGDDRVGISSRPSASEN